MAFLRVIGVLVLMALVFTVPDAIAQAPAPTYALKATIPIPTWSNLTTPLSVDINWINPDTQTFVMADRSPDGGAIEVLDAANYTFTRAAALGQFTGIVPNQRGAPNGVVSVGPNDVAAGDGNSTLKVVNLVTDEVQVISTGGERRVDEMAYDPASDLLIAANDQEDPRFVTVFKIHPLAIVGQIPIPQATTGIEQPLLAPGGKFWIAIPATVENPEGEIDLIDPIALSIERVLPVANCARPTGLAWGVGGRLITGGGGCVVDPLTSGGSAIPGAGGDEVASHPSRGVYAYTIADAHSLNLADGWTNEVYQQLPIDAPRNLAINPTNGEIWVPDYTTRSVLVFAPVTGE